MGTNKRCTKCKRDGGVQSLENEWTYECVYCQHRWCSAEARKAAYRDIQKIEFTVGGFHQGFYEVLVDFESGEVSYKHRLTMKTPIVKMLEHVEDEKKQLQSLQLLEWDESYHDPIILDGEQWSMDIVCSNNIFHKAGSNAHPKQWRKFCNWLNRLVDCKKLF